VAACGLAAISFAACQSTEQESAELARVGGAQPAGPAALALGASNRSVRASQVTLVSEPGRLAVAARLTNASARAQANVPLLVTVTGRGGKTLYTNGTGGIEASLQRIALLRGGQSAWWVDDQVLSSQPASAARLRAGTGSSGAGAGGIAVSTSAPQITRQGGVATLAASLVNRSSTAHSKVPVYAVAVRGGRVVAAGRAVVPILPGHPGASVTFQIVLVGNPAGASLQLDAIAGAG